MLGFFPELIDEELFYSGAGRYAHLLGPVGRRKLMASIFGSSGGHPLVELPCRLDDFIRNLPGGNELSICDLINRHTTLPYYSRFLSPETVARARLEMAGPSRKITGPGIGATSARLPRHDHLMFCEGCATADESRHGFAAWKRVHQLPGVFVCPDHGTPLMVSPIKKSDQVPRRFLALTADVRAAAEISKVPHPVLCKRLAADSSWLLRNPGEGSSDQDLRARVRRALEMNGWLRFGHLRATQLRDAILSEYGALTLHALGCPINAQSHNDWITLLLTRYPSFRPHPVRYLLLLAILRVSIGDFFAARLGDDTPDAAAQANQMRHVSRVLRIKSGLGHAARINALPQQRLSKESADLRVRGFTRRERIQRHRRQWLQAIAKHPGLSRSQLGRMYTTVRGYLRQHDGEWFRAHQPQSTGRRVDWGRRDADLSARVPMAVTKILALPGKPRRVTKSSIAQELGCPSIIRRNASRLPTLTRAIQEAEESELAFVRRRILRVCQHILRNGRTPTRTDILHHVHFREHTLKLLSPEIDDLVMRLHIEPRPTR